MVTQQNIEDKGFKLTETIEDYYSSVGDIVITKYLALALIEKENEEDIEFPIELYHDADEGLLAIRTFYNNPKQMNEVFQMGVIKTTEEFDSLISRLDWGIKQIDLTKLNTYA
jgi:hypothetical protein